MINDEYGLTPIKLIFTIIILMAIIVVAVFVVGRLVENNHVTDIKTDLLYIKAKCKGLNDKKIVDSNQTLLGEEINEFHGNDMIHQIVSGEDKWYKLSQEDLNQIDVGYLNAEDGFIVNYDSGEIIYAKGVKEEEETFYKLSDMIEEDEQEEQTENQETEQQEENSSEEQQTETSTEEK